MLSLIVFLNNLVVIFENILEEKMTERMEDRSVPIIIDKKEL